MSEWEKRLEKPSVPLAAKGPPGPPKIVEIEKKYSAIEEQTACCYMFVEGNPAPTFKFFKGTQEIIEGGRYKLISDGDNNNMIMMAIAKVKAADESEYRVEIENCHGSDEANFMLFVSDGSGMDFRTMLKKKKYAKNVNDEGDPDWGKLKKVERPDGSDSDPDKQAGKRHSVSSEGQDSWPGLKPVKPLRRLSQQPPGPRRKSLAEVIPDWPTLKPFKGKPKKAPPKVSFLVIILNFKA
jgi:hypothetical protein